MKIFGFNITRAESDRKFLSGEDVVKSIDPMLLSAFFGCLRIRSESFASLDLKEYKRTSSGIVETNDTGILDLLEFMPNKKTTAYNFNETMSINMMLGGIGCAFIKRNRYNKILELVQIPHDMIDIKIDRDSKITYRIDNKDYFDDDLFRVPFLSINGRLGMSLLQCADTSVRLGYQFDRYQYNFLRNGGFPSGVYELPDKLSPEAYDKFVERSKQHTGGDNTGSPLVLDGGIKYNSISVDPVDAEILASKKYNALDLCRFFRVPPHMIYELDRATFSNIEHQGIEFVQSLIPDCKRFESAISTQLLSEDMIKAGYFLKYDFSSFLRADMKTRFESWNIARNGGWMSVNEIRKKEDMEPIDGGDIYLEPLNMQKAGIPDEKSNN